MEVFRERKLDDSACAREQVPSPRLQRGEPVRPAPHLGHEHTATEPLGQIAEVPHPEIESPPPNVQRTELESPPDEPRNTDLDRDTDPHLHADARTTRAACGEKDKRGTIPRALAGSRARTHAHRPDTIRSDDESTRADDERPRPRRDCDDPRSSAQIERKADRPNRERHRGAGVVRDVQCRRGARDDGRPGGPHDQPGPARCAGRSRRCRRQADKADQQQPGDQRGTTVYVTVAVY